jgi:hypothetical protein
MDKENKNKPQNLAGLETFLEKRLTAIFYISLFFFLILSLLSFDAKMSTGGDDASYMVRAYRLIMQGTFPTFQGPLYPIFLSPFVAAFGLHINLLKTLSILLGLGSLWMFFKAFRGRISAIVLTFALLFQTFNAQLIYYASQTYSEMFFLFMQGIFIYFFFLFLDRIYPKDTLVKRDYKKWLLIGFLALMVVLSKNIGLSLVISLFVFFLFQKKIISAAMSLVSFFVVYFPYRWLRDLIWNSESPFTKQGSVFLYKDPYNFDKGKEDIWGFLHRLFENTHIYLSKNFPKIMSLRAPDVTDRVEIISYIIIALLLFTFIRALIKKHREILFITIYTVITLSITFVILQTRWDSDRLIVMMVPYLILLILYATNDLLGLINKRLISVVVYLLLALLLLKNVTYCFEKVDLLSMKKNLRGDRYHGYTPDWVNYIKMSEWVAKNIDENELVAARKQTMSIIFSGGRDFHSISRVPSDDPDTLYNLLKEKEVKYVIMASLRRNPKEKSKYTINTVQRYLSTIERKYPGTFVKVHQEGTSEPAYLFKIQYR